MDCIRLKFPAQDKRLAELEEEVAKLTHERRVLCIWLMAVIAAALILSAGTASLLFQLHEIGLV